MKIVLRILMLRWTVIFLVIFVSGCQAIGTHNERYYGNENSPNFRVPTDSIFVLNQELIVARKRRRAYFQFGRALAQFHQVNRHQPWCVLRLHAKKDTARRIEPDKFIVRSVRSRSLYEIGLIGPVKVVQRRRQGHDFSYQVYALEKQIASLTEREREVMDSLAEGHTNKAVAEQLGISPRTVEVHRQRVLEKCEVKSVPQLIRLLTQTDTSTVGA